VAHFYHKKGKHIVTSKIEHKAVLDTCRQLEREGYDITYLDPDEHGLTTPAMIQEVLREDTILVSVMHANNEIGVVNDVAGIGEVCRAAGCAAACGCRSGGGKGASGYGADENRSAVDVSP
jgi:cysteine desulfurase